MIRCRRCKQHFMSIAAYGIHTWMVQEIGPHKKVCPTEATLKAQGMSRFKGQWVFLSAEEWLKLPSEDRSTRTPEMEHAEHDC